MISIIVCSRSVEIPINLKNNIAKTIGTDYEIVSINNENNEFTIFEAYNQGVCIAKGDILCFMHDDILFRSVNWGQMVSKAFENEKCGLVGVVGCQFLSNKVQSWWTLGHHLGCITQGYIGDGQYKTFMDGEPLGVESKQGVAVDGLWFCIRRELFDQIRFDDKTYDGFHCYDVDICMQVLDAGYQVRVLRDVHIEHKSGGQVSDKFYEQLGKFVTKWGKELPVSRGLGWGRVGTKIYQLYRILNGR